MGRIYLQAGLLDRALTEFNLVSESIANIATPSASAFGSPNSSPNLSRVGSQVSVVSGHLSQGSGGRGTSGAGGVTQRLKNLVNMNAALMASAQGDWVRAEEILRGLVAVNPGDFVVSFSFFFFHSFWFSVWPLVFVSLRPRSGWGSPSSGPPVPSRHYSVDRNLENRNVTHRWFFWEGGQPIAFAVLRRRHLADFFR